MSIQTKRAYPDNVDRSEVLADYRAYLQKDMVSFTNEEISWVSEIMKRMYTQCSKLSPTLILPEIKLIKTHAKHYGTTVYYTRENIIVIPKYVLEGGDKEAFYSTMLHELFHIYSRYNPEKQVALYDLIGYKKIENPENLSFDKKLQDRMLTNPDGVNIGFMIKLKREGATPLLAIPIVFSKKDHFDPSQKQFFDYLDFSLYEVKPPLSRMLKVISDENGFSTIDPSMMGEYFRQIKDNTNYIIHPDEIMADNFMYAIHTVESPDYLNKFSEQGQELIGEIMRVLRE